MTDREIMQQALDALEYHTMQTRPISHTDKAIEALEAALAQPEQEPVCDKDPSLCGFTLCQLAKVCKHTPRNTMPTKIFAPNLEQILNAAGFYRREWVGLTINEVWDVYEEDNYDAVQFARAIEAKLRELNT